MKLVKKERDFRKHVKAFIYDKKGKLLSFGESNYIKTHPLMAKLANAQNEPRKIFLHAEVAAFIRCKDISKAHKIVILATSVEGYIRSGKPCKICLELLRQSNIKVIEHS